MTFLSHRSCRPCEVGGCKLRVQKSLRGERALEIGIPTHRAVPRLSFKQMDRWIGGTIDGQGANTCLNMDQIQETRYQPTELKKNWQMLMMITLRTVLLLAKLLYTVLALTRPKPLSWASVPTML